MKKKWKRSNDTPNHYMKSAQICSFFCPFFRIRSEYKNLLRARKKIAVVAQF